MIIRYAVALMLAALLAGPVHAQSNKSDYLLFQKIFEEWTAAFNRKDLAKSCALFSKSLTADYQGAPRRTYASVREGFKRVFADKGRKYVYGFDLHDVYRSGDLAVAKISWYLSVYRDGRRISFTEDRGLDVFQRNARGQWQIVYYLAYEEPEKTKRPGQARP